MPVFNHLPKSFLNNLKPALIMTKKKEYYQYDKKRRRLAKIYSKQKLIMGIGNSILIPLAAILILFFAGFFKLTADWALNTAGSIGGIVLFVLILYAVLLVFEFPLKLYASFFYEHKYKLSKQTIGKWLIDFMKETLIEFLIAVPVGSIIAFLIMNVKLWWLLAAAVSVAASLFVNFIYPIVIVPFIYKLEPYKNKTELKKIIEIVKKAGAEHIKRIFVLKESEKSHKVNAFFAGLGSTKSITLYDNLIDKFTNREVRTVIGHELGHYVNKDIIKMETLGAFLALISFYAADFIIRRLFDIPAVEGIPLYLFPALSGILIVINFVLMPVGTGYSRKVEYAADKFALDYVRDPLAQISTDKRLADLGLSNINPHPFIEFWFYDHPAIEKRVKASEQWLKENKE